MVSAASSMSKWAEWSGVARAVERRDTQPEQAARDVLEVAGEILAAHAGQPDLLDVRGRRRPAAAARTQTAVTSGSLKTASVPRRNATSIVARLATDRPRAICVIRSSTWAAARSLKVRIVPISSTSSGMTFGLVPPRMQPNVTTQGSRASTDRGTNW